MSVRGRERGRGERRQLKDTTGTPTWRPSLPPPSLVWLKHDLRLDDHPGFTASASTLPSRVAVVYVLDPALAAASLGAAGPCGAAGLAGALAALRAALRVRGSDLIIVRCAPGGAGAAVANVAATVGAATVHAETEPIAAWADATAVAATALSTAGARLTTWTAPLHVGGLGGDSYKAHTRARGPRLPLLPAPGALPPPPDGVAVGDLPTVDEIMGLAAAAAVPEGGGRAGARPAPPLVAFGAPPAAADAARDAAAGGEPTARAALAAYLTAGGAVGVAGDPVTARRAACLEAAVSSAEAPATPGGSFAAVFAPALALGTLSRRRVAADAAAALARLPPRAGRHRAARVGRRARAAAAAADASDFHALMAATRAGAPAVGGGTLRHWRWRGVLVEYVEAHPETPKPGAPALLLIHGFGAFGEQWRGVTQAAVAAGYSVYAPTLPGYGRSEKPPLAYGQDAWSSFVADFAETIIRCPAVAAGNSIGGYIVAAAAAAHPAAFAGVALLNPAGRVDGLASAAADASTTGGGAPVQPASAAAPPPQPPVCGGGVAHSVPVPGAVHWENTQTALPHQPARGRRVARVRDRARRRRPGRPGRVSVGVLHAAPPGAGHAAGARVWGACRDSAGRAGPVERRARPGCRPGGRRPWRHPETVRRGALPP